MAIVLPGRRYTALGPAIRIPILALEQRGFAIREIAYPEVPQTKGGFPWESFGAVAARHIAEATEGDDWEDTVVVAKSLGTGVLAHIGGQLDLPAPRAIWLTPLFRSAAIRERAIGLGWRSLIVAGSADDAHDPDAFTQVATSLGADTLLIDGADHGLEVPGDVVTTVDVMRRLAVATLAFASL